MNKLVSKISPFAVCLPTNFPPYQDASPDSNSPSDNEKTGFIKLQSRKIIKKGFINIISGFFTVCLNKDYSVAIIPGYEWKINTLGGY